MIAIAESGSTKTEWIILDDKSGEVVENIRTEGYNPDFHSRDYVINSLITIKEFQSLKNEIRTIYFYGAGCSNIHLNKIIEEALETFFPNADVSVDHDLLAAACSIYQGEEVICGILGTGSNSCYYDGEKIYEEVPALGFIMGDEGSGGSIGKRFLADFFYKRLPAEIHEDFKRTYNLTWAKSRKEIYAGNKANVYCASFMPFIAKYKETAYVKGIISQAMADFIEVHIKCFENYKSNKVGFVGSIAYFFQDIIKIELEKAGFQLVNVIKNPAMPLVEYHLKYKVQLNTISK